jgi:uncharacterized protein
MKINKLITAFTLIVFSTLLFSFFVFSFFTKTDFLKKTNKKLPEPAPSSLPIQSSLTAGACTFEIEIADTESKRQQGLSGRNNLAENKGMLFVFEQPAKYGFWMKDMNFSLDFIWIKDNQIVDLSENIPPPGDKFMPKVDPKQNVNKVLEINSGQIKKCRINIGDEVKINPAD